MRAGDDVLCVTAAYQHNGSIPRVYNVMDASGAARGSGGMAAMAKTRQQQWRHYGAATVLFWRVGTGGRLRAAGGLQLRAAYHVVTLIDG